MAGVKWKGCCKQLSGSGACGTEQGLRDGVGPAGLSKACGTEWGLRDRVGPVGLSKACGMEQGLQDGVVVTQKQSPLGGWAQPGSAADAEARPQPGWPAGSVVHVSPGHALYCPCRERKASGRVVSLAASLSR